MPYAYSRPYVYSFLQIFQALHLFPALRLFQTLEYYGNHSTSAEKIGKIDTFIDFGSLKSNTTHILQLIYSN